MMHSCARWHAIAHRLHGHTFTQATMVKWWATIAKVVRVGGMEIAAAIASMYPPNEQHPVFYHFKCVEGVSSLDMKNVIAYPKLCTASIAGEISEDRVQLSHLFQQGKKPNPTGLRKVCKNLKAQRLYQYHMLNVENPYVHQDRRMTCSFEIESWSNPAYS